MLKIGNLTKNGQTHFVCATDGRGDTNVPNLQWYVRRSEIIQRMIEALQNNAHGTV